MGLINVAEALARVLSRAPQPEARLRPLSSCDGRFLAEAVVAQRDQPPFAAAAMDGYALIKPESGCDEGRPFRVIGQSLAGRRFRGTLGVWEAVRIFTGGPVPVDATMVVMQEDVERRGDDIYIATSVWNGKTNIRPRGGDFLADDKLLTPGDRMDAWRLSLAAAAGRAELKVARRPRVALVSTGSELVAPGRKAAADQIYESNSVALASLVREWGGKPCHCGIVKDDLKALETRLAEIKADLIVTIGGASVGDFDLVKPALERLGYQPDFDKIAIRPGKPTSFGVLADGRKVLGLPGNPASALICAQLFLKPFLRASLGARLDTLSHLPVAADLASNGDRETYLRARMLTSEGRDGLAPLVDQDSSLVQMLAQTQGLILRPAGAPAAQKGDWLPFIPLHRR